MPTSPDVPPAFLSEWAPVVWVTVGLLAGVSLTVAWLASDWLAEGRRILALATAVPAALVLGVAPGVMFRHLPTMKASGLLLVGWLVAAGVLAFGGWAVDSMYRYGVTQWSRKGGAIIIAGGGALGFGYDALCRAAASIPMPVGSLLALIVLGAVVFGLWIASGRR